MGEKLLLTGRAGSGKTRAALERLIPLLRAGRSPEALLLLPTQSQVDHLRGVLLRGGIPAFQDDFAHTFFTLARTLSKVPPERLLTQEAKDALLGEVLRVEQLPSFEKIRDTRGFRRMLGAALQELKQNSLRPPDYARRVIEVLGGKRGARQRHLDLERAFVAYEARLGRLGRLDQEDLELEALARLEADATLMSERTLLLVDGFHDFTGVQLRLLRSLAQRCRESIFTLSFDTSRPDHAPFEVSRATRESILGMGFVERPLAGNHRTGDATLRSLERGLFEEAPEPVRPGDAALHILRSPRREDEVESIARSIVRLVREEGAAYRDIAVLYHDLGEVADLLEGTFRRFSIPLRIHRPRPLERQPIVRFLLDLGKLLAEGPRRETLLRLLRSGYVEGVPAAEVDRLDQAIREQGAPESPIGWKGLCGEAGLGKIGRLLERLRKSGEQAKGRHSPDVLAAIWIRCFEDLALPVGEQGEEGASECAALGEFLRLFDSVEILHGKGPITMALLVGGIREAAAVATFRLPDRRREAVNAIDAREARQWEVPLLFVAGVLERQFPPAPLEDLFFDDAERTLLNSRGLRFPDRAMRQAEERFLFYTAITRARRRLHISHASADAKGDPTLASFFLREVEKLIDPASLDRVIEERAASRVLPPAEGIVLVEDVDRAVFLGLEARHPRGEMPPEVGLAAALYGLRREDPAFRDTLRRALEGIRPVLAQPALREELARRDTAFSNSALTSFLQCPYLHFAQKWMRLEALPEREIGPLDLGSVLHQTLRDFFAAGGAGDPFDLLERNFESVGRARAQTFRSKAEFWRLRRALAAVLEAEKGREGSLRPALFEVAFGTSSSDSRPPVTLTMAGREEKLSGRIDRIDADPEGKIGYVVDYKYSDPMTVAKELKANAGEEMSEFQVAIYLMALKQVMGMEPAGAELLSMKREVRRFPVGRESLVRWWAPPEKTRVLGDDEFDAYLGRASEAIGSVIAGARSADVATRPRDLGACGPGSCPAADVCRYDRWIGRNQEGD